MWGKLYRYMDEMPTGNKIVDALFLEAGHNLSSFVHKPMVMLSISKGEAYRGLRGIMKQKGYIKHIS